MKEIETLVEEKTKESLDVSRLTREGEAAVGGSSGWHCLPNLTRWQQWVAMPAQAHQVAAPTGFAQPIICQLLLG